MSCEYDRLAIRYSVACICQLMGWNTVQSSALEYLTDITQDYMNVIGKLANRYATLLGQTEVNLDHLAIAFKDIGISVTDLEEYTASIDTGPVLDVPVYPVAKESHLNLLKPGSREVVTRPVHIHEHLPPMYPQLEDQEYVNSKETVAEVVENPPASPKATTVFKKPGDPVPSDLRKRTATEEEIRPLREISSVMMTTSGFLSPAREGKLPEARSVIPLEEEHKEEKPAELVNKHVSAPVPVQIQKIEKKKKKERSHDLKVDRAKDDHEKHEEQKVKKPKEPKIKMHKTSTKPLLVTPIKLEKKSHKLRVALQGTSESHKTSSKVKSPLKMDVDDVYNEKLPSEPDRQKLNIFKRISKVKDDTDDFYKDSGDLKETKRLLLKETIESVIQKGRLSSETTKETPVEKPPKITSYASSPGPFDMELPYDDPIFSGSPSTPRTPDIPAGFEMKKRKRDKNKDKREKEKYMSSPKSSRYMAYESPPKPKTPEVDYGQDDSLPPPTYPYNYYQTGLGYPVPPTINHPLIPSPVPLMNMYPKPPTLPLMQSQIRETLKIPYSLPPSLSISSVPAPSTSNTSTAPTPAEEENDNMPIDLSDHSPSKTEPTPFVAKEKKKDKKLKDKIKKKKAKKEKVKSKDKLDKLERKKLKLEKKERNKEKAKLKKDKKEKKEKKEKKAKKEKKRDRDNPEERIDGIVPKLKVRLLSPDEGSPDRANHRKIVIKPIVKKDEPEDIPIPKLTPSTSFTKIKSSKKSDHANPSSSSTQSTSSVQPTSFAGFNLHPSLTITPTPIAAPQESEGGQLWICPACRRVDDGVLAMIACDSCDMWFHWICVGIQEPPDSDWYCQTCIQQKGGLIEKLKKKQKKKKLSAM